MAQVHLHFLRLDWIDFDRGDRIESVVRYLTKNDYSKGGVGNNKVEGIM